MMRVAFGAAAAALLAGCATTPAADDGVHYVSVQSVPDKATITFSDGATCLTPCRVGVLDEVEFVIARTGYKPKTIRLKDNTKSSATITLEPVVTETELEEFDLPDLQ